MTHEEFRSLVEDQLDLQKDLARADKREHDKFDSWLRELVELVKGAGK